MLCWHVHWEQLRSIFWKPSTMLRCLKILQSFFFLIKRSPILEFAMSRICQSVWGRTNCHPAKRFLPIFNEVSRGSELSVIEPGFCNRSLFPVRFGEPIRIVVVVLNGGLYLRLGIVLLIERERPLLPISVEFILGDKGLIGLINGSKDIIMVLISVDPVITKVLIIF